MISKAVLCVIVMGTLLSVMYMPWSESWRSRNTGLDVVLVRKMAFSGDKEAQALYAYSLSLNKNTMPEAISWFRKSADNGFVPAMNNLAWILATDPDDRIRDGKQAVKYAKQACQATKWEDAHYLDTLAAAYAEGDQWTDAIDTQKKAIDRLEDKTERKELVARLDKYIKKQKFRE